MKRTQGISTMYFISIYEWSSCPSAADIINNITILAYMNDQVAHQPLTLLITLRIMLQYYLFSFPACYHYLNRNDMLESFQTMCRRIIILHILCWWIWCRPSAYNNQLTTQFKISVCIKKHCVWDMIPLMPMPNLFCWYYDDFTKKYLINFLSQGLTHIPQCKLSIYYYIIHLYP